jgi:hypothetical protein
VTRLEQITHHAFAHRADTDKSNFHPLLRCSAAFVTFVAR